MGSRRETADRATWLQLSEEIIDYDVSMSKTDQYRKVMKPLIERKRRARINSCLDELKDLMVFALQTEGESISKLEKADVLELTVNHLRKLKRQQMLSLNPALDFADEACRLAPRPLADHHHVHAAQEEAVIETVRPAHLVDVLVPVEHVAVLADPVQVLQHAQARARAAPKRVSRVNTKSVAGPGCGKQAAD